jgi:hypothetical protein
MREITVVFSARRNSPALSQRKSSTLTFVVMLGTP